jgi:hypothetical protein
MSFDITKLDIVSTSEEGHDVHIINPKTDESTGIVIKVKGMFSARIQELIAKQKKRDAMRARSAVAKAVADEEDEIPALLSEAALNWGTVDEKDDQVVNWGDINEGGKPVKFSKAEALRVFTDYPLIRGQVLAAVADVKNFIKG